MTKSDLIDILCTKNAKLSTKDVELGCKEILDSLSDTLIDRERIEIRGFGSFSVHTRKPRTGRNPKTGDQVALEAKFVPHFKPGKELRERVNQGAATS